MVASYFFLSSLQLKLKPLEGRGYVLGAPQWQIDGENVETVLDFIFLDSKISVDGDCSHKIKRGLLFGRIAMTNLDSVLKSRDITFKAVVSLVVLYRCESWMIKKAECQRTDVFFFLHLFSSVGGQPLHNIAVGLVIC